tara:strand:- start:125 stop:391 length:267 start_codon:yes stop_codon:yes gene_type:complete
MTKKKNNPYRGTYIYETVSWEYRSKDVMINEKNLFKLLYILISIRSVDMFEKTISRFKEKYGEGTAADLDYGKLVILALCIYIAIQVS